MNPYKNITNILALLLLLVFASCEEKSTITPSKTAILTSGIWVGTTVYEGGENKTQEYADQNLDIRKFEVEFVSNGRVSVTYNNGRPDVGTWKLINDETAILFEENTPNEKEGSILVLTESEFRVRDEEADLEMWFVKKDVE